MNYVNMDAAPEAVAQGDLIIVDGVVCSVDHSGPDAPGWSIDYTVRSANGRVETNYLWFDGESDASVALVVVQQ